MSTVDPDVLALIHGEIDGENTPAESARLARLAADDPSVRARLEQMRRLSAVLATYPEIEPPPGLRQAILAALPRFPSRERWRLRSGGWAWPVFARYAVSFGLGFAVAATLWTGTAGPVAVAVEDAAATLSPASAPRPAHAIEFAGASGTVRLGERNHEATVDFDLAVRTPVRVSLRWPDQADEAVPVFDLAEGQHRFAVVLPVRVAEGLQVRVDGTVVRGSAAVDL